MRNLSFEDEVRGFSVAFSAAPIFFSPYMSLDVSLPLFANVADISVARLAKLRPCWMHI